jgi:hypothetical protein
LIVKFGKKTSEYKQRQPGSSDPRYTPKGYLRKARLYVIEEEPSEFGPYYKLVNERNDIWVSGKPGFNPTGDAFVIVQYTEAGSGTYGESRPGIRARSSHLSLLRLLSARGTSRQSASPTALETAQLTVPSAVKTVHSDRQRRNHANFMNECLTRTLLGPCCIHHRGELCDGKMSRVTRLNDRQPSGVHRSDDSRNSRS